jgi:peptide/nickel transport system substrate-binding protein
MRTWRSVVLVAVVLLTACGPSQRPDQAASPDAGRAGQAGVPGGPKTITVVTGTPLQGFPPVFRPPFAGGARVMVEIHMAPLVSSDRNGGLEPRLAAKLPSFGEGSIQVLPDGRMRTIWPLRPNVKWHDGAPFTANDVVFGWQVQIDPALPMQVSAEMAEMELVEVLDPLTVAITYKSTYYRAVGLETLTLDPLPHHLLAEAFQGDKEVFQRLPYWTSGWVHLGPFRLVDFGLGEEMVFERFDAYFLGRPKVDRIVLRAISDRNTVFANTLAGTVDIVGELAMGAEQMLQLREEWQHNSGGVIVARQGSWVFMSPQFSPEWGRPLELGRDARIRRGLYGAVDRDALREALYPGFAETEGDSFMPGKDPRAAMVGRPFARYRYDPALAERELAAAGWRRGADGRMLNAAGEPVELTLRASVGHSPNAPIVAQYWRTLGVTVTEEIVAAAMQRDNEYVAKYTGIEFTSQSSGDGIWGRFDSRRLPTPQNRWTGSAATYYVNPGLDGMIARLYQTVEPNEQGALLRDMGEILAEDLAAMALYFEVRLSAVRAGTRALVDDYPATMRVGQITRHAHLWERD